MPQLSDEDAVEQARDLRKVRSDESERLDKIRDYLRDDAEKPLQGLPSGTPGEMWALAKVSRENVLKFIVNSRVQSLHVEGFRTPESNEDLAVWDVWRRNKMNARQIGIYRSALAYGATYATVLPGSPVPVIRGVSPRDMTVLYGDDDEWPVYALEKRRTRWRMLDNEFVYWLRQGEGDRFEVTEVQRHGVTYAGEPVCPVVRYRETEDLDSNVQGLVEPYMAMQDQINLQTFGALVVLHYNGFRQRYILGWLAETETEKLRASASKLWTFEDSPQDVQVGEFSQTDVSGYIDSREATLRHLATMSQTPAHELVGQLANLSAEALAAANASKERAISENRTVIGESHETLFRLVGEMIDQPPPANAYVRWRDSEVRSFAATVDALGKLAQQLGVPVEELWEMVPYVSQDQIASWKQTAAQSDALGQLDAMIERQMTSAQEATSSGG